jgi:anti-sigma B factor antagonist
MEFGFAVRSFNERTVVTLTGELDLDSVDTLQAALAQAANAGAVDVDMSGVTFMDSSGLRGLIGAYKKLAADGRRLRIVEPSDRVVRLLKLTGQYERFTEPEADAPTA